MVVAETANHWLGGLDTEGFDRYVYEKGLFRSYDPFEDKPLAEHLGQVLGFVLRAIPLYPGQAPLPIEDVWYREAAVPEAHVPHLVELFLDSGFLQWQDIAGEVEAYSIDPDFEWPARWAKFGQERKKFEDMLAALCVPETSPTVDSVALTEEIDANTPAYPMLAPPDQHDPDLAKHDAVLAALFEVLGKLPVPLPVSPADVRDELYSAGFPEELAQAWAQVEIGVLRTAYILNRKRKQVPNGLEPNKAWAAAYHLYHYPKALAAWRKAILHKT